MPIATVEIQTFDLAYTKETLDKAGIKYVVETYSTHWIMTLCSERSVIENWMKTEYCVGMDEETAAEFMADIENI
ncbi:hypothetical protein CPT_Muldoon_099 [Serratia phage Muldoon]|uniref:Uncharacterized 8.8 kDa protein in frd-Gp32 intergenic region n=1 Tax=Serratia phage Muldoon TaxID=2601678 RepID=A0A5P8PHC4_9CAUD|nr:hypothetical protein HYP94_gp098 [Serratia phage Muldoon]QFR56054.1 hypothetical protein CPT_Muldoon_099 [Serratia phage Muldoon]